MMDKTIIAEHLYNDSVLQAVSFVKSIQDEETLFVYALNYNWDNGFEVPKAILDNENCSLSIALLLFHLADGFSYLQDKEEAEGTKTWFAFIKALYKRILSGAFIQGVASFKPQLSRVQEYKLKKMLSSKEMIFISSIDGTDCYEEIL